MADHRALERVASTVEVSEFVPRTRGPIGRTLQHLVAQVGYLASGLFGDDVLGRSARATVLRALGAKLATGASMHGGTYISRPEHLVIGEGSFINRKCYLDLESMLIIGAGVTVGHGTTFITTRHRLGGRQKRCDGYSAASITVGDGAWLGANVTVLAGIVIGSGAVVAAGAVVCDDVPADTLVAGVPARVCRFLEPSATN